MAYEEAEVKLHIFLHSGPHWGIQLHVRHRFNTGIFRTGGWVDPKGGWDQLKQRKFLALLTVNSQFLTQIKFMYNTMYGVCSQNTCIYTSYKVKLQVTKQYSLHEIWGCHSSVVDDSHLLECGAMSMGGVIPVTNNSSFTFKSQVIQEGLGRFFLDCPTLKMKVKLKPEAEKNHKSPKNSWDRELEPYKAGIPTTYFEIWILLMKTEAFICLCFHLSTLYYKYNNCTLVIYFCAQRCSSSECWQSHYKLQDFKQTVVTTVCPCIRLAFRIGVCRGMKSSWHFGYHYSSNLMQHVSHIQFPWAYEPHHKGKWGIGCEVTQHFRKSAFLYTALSYTLQATMKA